MSRSWREVKAEKNARDRAAGRDVEAARARAKEVTEAHLVGFRLAQLREQAGVSQTELARRIGVSQPRVSQLENGDLAQMELDTVRRYIAALGGRLRVVAGFDDRDVVVSA
ncbi:helix-turn-helix domain-containing protein [Amycolatopsis sp. 195334CR]|uniref:helix-turn-helix domain-containing protein n=1 Tax=Amycolatopsis sp. 195334CR TaxID=2814588 RepID=UPI001A8DC525|nr:XRE family transcriptional regulator [Amycolatopsis sp. 195334CR]MBN6038588.1 XRE family transcriptional regulator [Amycolatopsis sp. 195334CR]